MNIPLFSVQNAKKSYGGVPVLHDVSLELNAGDVHALMGENGAGKSTLIKILAGVVSPDAVSLQLRGQPITISSPADAERHGLRFIHQELNVVPALSVAENIFLGQRYPRRLGVLVDWPRLHASTRALLADLGIHHLRPEMLMARLAPGDAMLVKIAAAFVAPPSQPSPAHGRRGETPPNTGAAFEADNAPMPQTGASLYVMDEPTAALSRAETELLFGVIERLKARGAAVLYVSHRMEDIFRICDRVTVMRDGRVVLAEPIAAVNPDVLIRSMTGRQLAGAIPPRTGSIGDGARLAVNGLTTDKVQGVSFAVRAGEIVGVAGLTGAGRTELLRAIMRADRVRAGSVLLDGEPLAYRSPAGAWRSGVAFVPEERRAQGVILSHRIDHNVVFPHLDTFSRARTLHGGAFVHRGRERSTSQTLGESVRLRSRGVAQHVRELSGGNQQKVVFARALAGQPRLLLLDEPTRGVDVGAKYDLYALIRQISDGGAAVLIASSDLPELIGLCDRLLILREGRLVGEISTDGLTEDRLLSLCYGEIDMGMNTGIAHAGK